MTFKTATAIFAAGLIAQSHAALAQSETDLREFRVGMAQKDLPPAGYVNFTCGSGETRAISGWQDWKSCPADANGLHSVRFEYDPLTQPDGTKVAGHPVILSVQLSDSGLLDGLVIETEPKSRPFLRKKAFLFGLQAKSRYGEDGWTCKQGEPGNDRIAIGGMFVDEDCKKVSDGREFVIHRSLYLQQGRDLKDFTGGTKIQITMANK